MHVILFNRFVAGDRGTGKSTTLNQAVLHARKSGWLCLFVPKGWDQVQSGSFVEPLPWNENVYDNQLMSVEVLRGFWMAHSEVLKTIPIKNMGIFDKYESHQAAFREAWNRALSVSGRSSLGFIQMRGIVLADDHFPAIDKLDTPILSNFDFLSFKPKTLEDLVRFGVAFTDLSGSVFMDLVEELKQLQEHKVLIAVDQYNTWEAPSAYSYNYKKLYGKDLCVPKALQFICKKKADSEKMKLANGLFICATSFKHTDGLKETFEQMLSSVPLFVKVPYYSQLEFLSSLSALMGSKLLPDDLTIQDILAYRMQTASSPRLIRDELVSFFFQRLSDRNNEQLKALRTATQLKEFNDSNENDASDDGYNGDAISDKSETNGKSEDVSMLVDKLLDRDNRKSMKR